MKAPVLNTRLVLEGPVLAADGAGGYDTSWEALGTLWGELRPGRGRAVKGANASLSRVPYRIVVRGAPIEAPSRPVPGQRLVHQSRVFAILAVTEADRNGQYLICHAEEETVR